MIHSLPEFNLPLIGAFYVTHATRTLPSHDLSGEGINFELHTYFFDPTRTWRASPDEESAQCRATSETTWTWKKIHTVHVPIHSNKTNMKGWLWRPNYIWGLCWPKALWHLSYKWRKPQKTSPRKIVPTGDRTRARWVTGAHTTACSTAVDDKYIK